LIKAIIPDHLLAEWFTKSLLPPIAHDVTMGGVVMEEEAIARAQYLDLVYSQFFTLYDLIQNSTHATTDPTFIHITCGWIYRLHQNPIFFPVEWNEKSTYFGAHS
jgi:hypothetical protein